MLHVEKYKQHLKTSYYNSKRAYFFVSRVFAIVSNRGSAVLTSHHRTNSDLVLLDRYTRSLDMVASTSSRRGLSTAAVAFLASVASAASCNTYSVTSPSGTNHTFNNYAFYDFRQLGDQISGTPMYSQDENFPNGQFALSTSPYFNSTPWTNNWSTTANLTVANHTLSQYTDDVFTPLNVAIGK